MFLSLCLMWKKRDASTHVRSQDSPPSSTVLLHQLLLQPPVLADDVRKVVDLTSANFSSAVDGSRFSIVNFYAGGLSSPSFAWGPSRNALPLHMGPSSCLCPSKRTGHEINMLE